jgi:hypothetical protein
MGKVQYEGWPEPPPVTECSGPGCVDTVRGHLEDEMGLKSTSTHGITFIYSSDEGHEGKRASNLPLREVRLIIPRIRI